MEIRIGSRESLLAVTQSEMLIDYINRNVPDVSTKLVTMKTTGDIILDRPLDGAGGKGLFVKELDRALMDNRTDLSVHSLKDMPMEVPDELPLIGFSKREDPRDVLVLPENCCEWDKTKPIGVSGKRRIVQLKALFPEIETKLIRGNVQTRLRKLDSGEYGANIKPAAGLKRLGLENRISRYFTTEEMMPAAGQGILAVQGRKGENWDILKGFFDENDSLCAIAERAFVCKLNGGCSSPIAAHAEITGDTMVLNGLWCEEDSLDFVKGTIKGNAADAGMLGEKLALQLKG